MNHANAFETDLDRNPANYAPLTPLTFIARAASAYPGRVVMTIVNMPMVLCLNLIVLFFFWA
jgi:hypothetical protein